MSTQGTRHSCKLILDLHLPSDDKTKAFILAETGFNGDAILFCAKKWADEAKLLIKHLLLFLQCKCPDAGDAVEKGFTLDAIEEAEDFHWDDDNKHLASKVMQELEANLASAEKSSANWVITGMEMLNEDISDNKEATCPMKKPAWEIASFKS